MHYVWQALFTLFLLYHELLSDHELFSVRELRDACTLATLWFSPIFTNYNQFSSIFTIFFHQFHQYYGLVSMDLKRIFQKYVYVLVLKQIAILTKYHQFSPICAPILPMLWLHIERLEETIPETYY